MSGSPGGGERVGSGATILPCVHCGPPPPPEPEALVWVSANPYFFGLISDGPFFFWQSAPCGVVTPREPGQEGWSQQILFDPGGTFLCFEENVLPSWKPHACCTGTVWRISLAGKLGPHPPPGSYKDRHDRTIVPAAQEEHEAEEWYLVWLMMVCMNKPLLHTMHACHCG